MLLPLIHPKDLRPDAGMPLILFFTAAGILTLLNAGIILGYRNVEREFSNEN